MDAALHFALVKAGKLPMYIIAHNTSAHPRIAADVLADIARSRRAGAQGLLKGFR